MDNRQFRNAMGKFATGVNVIATEVGGEVHGMTANAFMSVSMDPKLIVISIGAEAVMLDKITESQRFSVNVLTKDQEEESKIFAGQIESNKTIDFEELGGNPVLPDSLAQISCEVSSVHVEGDHTLFIGRVIDFNIRDDEPLLFSSGRYRTLAREKTSV